MLSDSVLHELHSPAMIEPKTVTFPERQSRGYALGCSVDSYRGHTLIDHGGSLIGYSSDVAIAPALGAGVAVLTNRHYSMLSDVLDRCRSSTASPAWPPSTGGANTSRPSAPSLRANVTLPRQRKIVLAGGHRRGRSTSSSAFTRTRPTVTSRSSPRRSPTTCWTPSSTDSATVSASCIAIRDSFALELREFEAQAPLIFTTDDADEIAGLTVPLEATVEAIAFTKRVCPIAPGLLLTAPGTYVLGPFEITVSVVDDVISVAAPTVGVVQLVSRGGSVFGGRDMPRLRFEFDGDTVNVQPLGVFTRVEKV